jgi:hypothetical protein
LKVPSFIDLLADPDWIVRRIETQRIGDLNYLDRRISLDIDCDVLKRRLQSIPDIFEMKADRDDPSEPVGLYIPIGLVDRSLLFSLSVQSSSKGTVPIAPFGVAIQQLIDAAYDILARNEFPRELIAEVNQERIRRLFTYGDTAPPEASTRSVCEQWTKMRNTKAFTALANIYEKKIPLLVWITLEPTPVIVKYDIREPLDPQNQPLTLERLGIHPYNFAPRVMALGAREQENYRLEAPIGMFLSGAELVSNDRREWDSLKQEPRRFSYFRRLAIDSAVVSLHDAVPGEYFTLWSLSSRFSSFYMPGLCTLFLGWCLQIMLGWSRGWLWPLSAPVEDSPDTSSVVALLALVPTIAAAFLAINAEHGLVRRFMTIPRLMLFIVAGLTTTLSLYIALRIVGWLGPTLFWVDLISTTSAGLLFFVSIRRIHRRRASIRDANSLTEQLPIGHLNQI